MTGKLARDVIFDFLLDLEIRYIFGVPGTNEIPIIDGTSIPANHAQYVPCLHENIALGAAMGLARMTGKPGVAVLHVTPGVGHSLGNLFNASKSHVPLVVLCGQQHNELVLQEPLLASDLVRVARQYTKWAYEIRSPDEFPIVLQRAFKVAMAPPSGPVFLSIPWDFTLGTVSHPGPGKVTRISPAFVGDREAVAAAAALLAGASSPVIVAGDGVGYADAWAELERLANLLGAPVYTEYLSSLMNYPNHLPHWQGELPADQKAIQKRFDDHDVAFLCGFNAQAQVVVYSYADGPLIPESVTQVYLHNDPWEIGKNHYGEVGILGGIKTTLPLLCDDIASHPSHQPAAAESRNEELRRLSQTRDEMFNAYAKEITQQEPSIPIQGSEVASALARLQDHMRAPLVYVHEALSDAMFFQKFLRYDTPSSYYCVEGGSLGYSMPASLGIKLAVGDQRTVVNAVGDGSALFYPQVWWTATKLELPILYVILNNKQYKTLVVGLDAVEQYYQWEPSGPADYLHLRQPPLSFVQIAESFGVRGGLVDESGQLDDAFHRALEVVESGNPYVLEVLTDPSVQRPRISAPEPRLDMVFSGEPTMTASFPPVV